MSIILTLICKMVTILRVMRECCDGGCDSNETGRDKAHLTAEWSFQIKTIIIIEAWPWWRASSPSLSFFIVPIQKYIIGMIFENICNEGGRDTLLIIITTSALTNVSFTLCCLLKNTDTWGVTPAQGVGAEISSSDEWVRVLLSCLNLCYGDDACTKRCRKQGPQVLKSTF